MTKKNKLITLFAAVIICACAVSASAQSSGLERFVDSLAEQHVGLNVAGISIGIARGNDVLLKNSYGSANLQWRVPMPMDAVHEVGSLTKQFTTVAMLQLHERGMLDFDADITEYLPNFDTRGQSIPMRRLVDHTSGIRSFTEIPEFADLAMLNKPREEMLRLIEQHPADFKPGEALIYNNSAYFLMGLIIERISGMSYEAYLEENIFPLAGMDDSSYCSNTRVVENKATGYSFTPDGLTLANYHDHTWPYSAGSVCSTISDLLAWNNALHNGAVLPPAQYEMFITPAPLNDGTPIRYAMGVSHYSHPTGRVIEHGGVIDGFFSFARHYPDDDVTIVVLMNTTGPISADAIADEISEHMFGNRALPPMRAYTGDLNRFVGEYRGAARGTGLTVTVTRVDDTLAVTLSAGPDAGTPLSVSWLEHDTFFAGTSRFIFDTTDQGQVSRLRLDEPTNHFVLDKLSVQ